MFDPNTDSEEDSMYQNSNVFYVSLSTSLDT